MNACGQCGTLRKSGSVRLWREKGEKILSLYEDLTCMHQDITLDLTFVIMVMNKSHRYSEEGKLIVGIS